MHIKKLIGKGMAVCTFLCMMTAVPAFASNICYLPSGQCGEESIRATARSVYGGGDDIGSVKDCHAYQTQSTDSWQNPPSQMYKGESDTKASCKHSCGSDAPDKDCIATCTTKNNVCYACDTEDESTKNRYAWFCKGSCASAGYVTEEEKEDMIGEGCYKFYQAMWEGNLCYRVDDLKLKEETSTIITKDERKAEYDDSCFTFEEYKVDGGVCYKPTRRVCGEHEYLAVTTAEGVVPEKCECKEYLLDFKLKKRDAKSWSSSVNLEFGPQAQIQQVTIVSTLTGDEGTTDVAYSIQSSTCDAIGCKVTSSGNQVTIACDANLTTEQKVCNIVAIQNNKDINAANRDKIGNLIIGVTVKPDSCGDYNVTEDCVEGSKAQKVEGVLSVAGQACYQCLNDECPEGTTTEEPESRDGYDVTKTDFGTECFAPKACVEGYSTDFQGVADCGDKAHPDGWSYDFLGYSGDKKCGKCIPATCNGEGYELKCIPEPDIPCENKDSDSCPWTCVGPIAAGDDVLFNCNPKACPDGDTNIKTVDDCTKIGHPEGWKIEEIAKSGTEVCNKCQPKACKGEGFTHKCEPQPRCLNPNDDNCGYKDITIEYEGDTPKYNSNDKVCPKGSKDIKSTANCTKNGHEEGWDIRTVGKSGEEPCNECIKRTCTGMGRQVKCTNGDKPLCDEKDAMCGYKDFVVEYEGDDPKISYNIKTCPDGTNTAMMMGCGKNIEVARAGTEICYIFEPADTTCPENYIYDGVRTCSCVCNLKVEAPWIVDTHACAPLCGLMPREGNTIDMANCKYVPIDCADGYSTAITSCPGNFTLKTAGKSGDGVCGKCECELQAPYPWEMDTNTCTPVCSLKDNKPGYTLDTAKCEYIAKPCPEGFSASVTSASCPSPRYSFSTNGQSGDQTCGKCECALQPHGNWLVDIATCTEYCPLGEKAGYKIDNCEYVPLPCESGYSTSVTSCSGNYKLETKGKSGDATCGRCVCNLQAKDGYTIENCNYKPIPCESGYNTSVTSCSGNYTLETKGKSGDKACGRCVCNLKAKEGYKIENCEYVPVCTLPEIPGYTLDKVKCEYIPKPCHKGNGLFGSACCVDTDCNSATGEFPLYCFQATSSDGSSAWSCRECGSMEDSEEFYKSPDRLEKKCNALANSTDIHKKCTKINSADGNPAWMYTDEYDRQTTAWWYGRKEVVFNHGGKSGNYTYKDFRVACRYGEVTTYDNTYKKLIDGKSVYGLNDTCPSGQVKNHRNLGSKFVNTGTTAFGSFCYMKQ